MERVFRCHHFCTDPLTCQTCVRRFYAWAEARTNSPPPRKHRGGPSFYAHVNVVSEPWFASNEGEIQEES